MVCDFACIYETCFLSAYLRHLDYKEQRLEQMIAMEVKSELTHVVCLRQDGTQSLVLPTSCFFVSVFERLLRNERTRTSGTNNG